MPKQNNLAQKHVTEKCLVRTHFEQIGLKFSFK